MDSLWSQLNDDMKAAMRAKDESVLSVLRMLISAIGYKKIALNKGTDPTPLGNPEIIDVIGSEIKKRRDSISSYEAGGRQDLADREKAEIPILAKYMPAQMDDSAVETAVREVISSLGEVTQKDFGRVMGQVMAKLKGQADGGKVTEIVKKVLGN